MDLKTEEIVKILLILGVLYLLFNCITTENFADTDIQKIKIVLMSENKPYRLVSFFNLKDEYKIVLLKELYNLYLPEETANKGKPEIERTSNTFLRFGGQEDTLIDISKPENANNMMEKLNTLNKNNVSKFPVLIIANDKLGEYTNDIFDFDLPSSKNGNGLISDSSRYLFWNPSHGMLFTSPNDSLKFEIKGTNSTVEADKQSFIINALKNIDNKEITPNKIVENTIKHNEKTLTHYVLSNTDGKPFVWKWHTDTGSYDFSKIF